TALLRRRNLSHHHVRQIAPDILHRSRHNPHAHPGTLPQFLRPHKQILRHSRDHAFTPSEMCFVSRNASSPSDPNSRPHPECFIPPNGALLVVGTPSLIPIIPASSFSIRRIVRSRFVVNA